MSPILCIETTTTNCSVSIATHGDTLSLIESNTHTYSHSENLHLYIQEALQVASVTKEQLVAIAISKGPGSYTGLRIGVSAAKGLCFALALPLIAINTLEALALQIKMSDGVIIPMLDARRMEVYTAVFDANYRQIEDTTAKILDENSFNNYLENGKVIFIGNANEKFKPICTHPNAQFIDGKLPSAKELGLLANEKYKKSDFESVAYFEPYYLKDFMGG